MTVLGAKASGVQTQGLEAPQPCSFPLLGKSRGRDVSCYDKAAEAPALGRFHPGWASPIPGWIGRFQILPLTCSGSQAQRDKVVIKLETRGWVGSLIRGGFMPGPWIEKFTWESGSCLGDGMI